MALETAALIALAITLHLAKRSKLDKAYSGQKGEYQTRT